MRKRGTRRSYLLLPVIPAGFVAPTRSPRRRIGPSLTPCSIAARRRTRAFLRS